MSVLDAETLTALSKELDERIRERRERIATAVLGHIVAATVEPYTTDADSDRMVHIQVGVAVEYADALIERLDKR